MWQADLHSGPPAQQAAPAVLPAGSRCGRTMAATDGPLRPCISLVSQVQCIWPGWWGDQAVDMNAVGPALPLKTQDMERDREQHPALIPVTLQVTQALPSHMACCFCSCCCWQDRASGARLQHGTELCTYSTSSGVQLTHTLELHDGALQVLVAIAVQQQQARVQMHTGPCPGLCRCKTCVIGDLANWQQGVITPCW